MHNRYAGVLDIPVIESSRLVLRGHRSSDLADCAALWSNPDVTRYITGQPLSREETWMRMLRYSGHWALMGFGYWLAEERSTGRFVGEFGLADYRRDMYPSIEGIPESGWILAPTAQGKGLATEAVRTMLAWAATRLSSTRTVCLIHPDNAASLRVAEKCGYRERRRTVRQGKPVIILESYFPAKKVIAL